MPTIVFSSTHHALSAEQILEDEGFDIDIVPPPANRRADCGLAIKIIGDDRAAIETMLHQAGIEFDLERE